MKCPVCNYELKEYDIRCYNCGFSNFRYQFTDQADVFNWLSEMVIPFREYWISHSEKEVNSEESKVSDNTANSKEENEAYDKETIRSTFITDGHIKWKIDFIENNEGAIISQYIGNNSVLKIPDVIKGKNIIGLGDGLFNGFKELTDVHLPSHLKFIGKDVFRNTHIKSIVIPETCVHIGESAFEDTLIKEINIPDSCEYIGRAAFKNTGIKEITFPGNVDVIEKEVCMDCYMLKDVIIKNASQICTDAFTNCRSLKKLSLPESVSVIHRDAFYSTIEDLILPASLKRIAFKNSNLEKSGCRIVFNSDDVLFSRSKESQKFDFGDLFDMFSSDTPAYGLFDDGRRTPIFYCNAGSNAYKYARNYGIRTYAIEDYPLNSQE